MAYDTSTEVRVAYSDLSEDYSIWHGPITLASRIDPDDLSAVVAFDNKARVLWSGQVQRLFGFKFHSDRDSPTF